MLDAGSLGAFSRRIPHGSLAPRRRGAEATHEMLQKAIDTISEWCEYAIVVLWRAYAGVKIGRP